MLKTIRFILLVIVLAVMLITPVRNFMNNLFQKDKAELEEERTMGTLSEHNPRLKEIQQILKEAGFESGKIDGMIGGKTRRAIKEFQKAKGLRPTGRIDSATQLALNKEKETAGLVRIESEPNVSLYEITLPDSEGGTLKAKDEDKKRKTEIQDEIIGYRLNSQSRTKQIQAALKKAGFYSDKIDGKPGPKTKKAVKAFQKAKGLTADGVVGPKTWKELSKYLNS